MATKQITLADIGEVTLLKRKSTRSLRLSIGPKGQIKVTMPYWVPYEAGARFARSKQDWIAEHLTVRNDIVLAHGQTIGKSHRLLFEASPVARKVSSRVDDTIVRITYPAGLATSEASVQVAAEKAGIRALRQQAEESLPGRLRALATMHGFDFNSVQVKQLTGRWGSCDAKQHIVLNLFLMELPWPLVDYVLLHELTHTNVLRHGPDFWRAMKRILPDTQVRRKAIKAYRPVIGHIV